MTKEIKTSIQINASKESIWKILTDFEKYPEWNPFVKSLTGKVEVGEKIHIKLPGINFKPKVLVFDKNREFKWLGHLLFKGLFDGEHRFLLKEQKDGSFQFIHSEKLSGLLVKMFSKSLDKDTTKGFKEMNMALKKRAESSN